LISNIFVNIGYVLLGINCVLLIKGFSKNEKPFKIFAIYCWSMFAVQLASLLVVKIYHSNLFISHFYFGLQFIILSFFFYSLMKERIQKRIISGLLAFCILVLGIQYTINPDLFCMFNLFEIFITSLPLIIYATFHLYNILNEKKQFYYITIGLLIYLFGSTVVFLTTNLLLSLKTYDSFEFVYSLNVYLYAIYQLFILFDLKHLYLLKKKNLYE